LFGVERIVVLGAPPGVARDIHAALAPFRGRSLVALDGGDVERRLLELPTVLSARYDRDFPHTLRVFVRAERPVAVLRSGSSSVLVSARGRVMRRLARGAFPALPRIWQPPGADLSPGTTLADDAGGGAARALAPLLGAPLPERVRAASYAAGDLRLLLVGGVELHLGGLEALRLKLAIARRIVADLPADTRYVDLSVPDRPVSGP
jgi:cell division protein FtsQ